MTQAVLDDREQRRAQARAEALALLDTPRRARRFDVVAGTALRPSPRPRVHARPRPAPQPRRHRPLVRRLVAAVLLVAQLVVLVLALTLPAFQVKGAQVAGVHLLRAGDVVAAAGIPRQSVFTLDTSAVRRRVEALPWVGAATVTTGLPASVRVTVSERPVALRLRRGGEDTLLAANGATMPVAAAASAPSGEAAALLDDRAGSSQPLAPALIEDLAAIAQHFQVVFGCHVAAYQWGVDDILALWASTGWKAVLGHLDTEDALAALPSQMAALAALRGSLDFAHPSFGYVDLEDPSAPAVGGSPGLPPAVQAAAQTAAAPPGTPATAGVPVPNPVTPAPPRASSSASPRPSPSPSTAASPSPAAAPSPAVSPSPAASLSPAASPSPAPR